MEYYSAIKNNEILPFMTTWKDPEGIMLSEISQRKTTLYDLAYMWNLKKTKQNKNELIVTENRSVVLRGGERRGGQQVKGVKRYKLPLIK